MGRLLGTCVCAGGRAALQVKKPQERVRKVKEAVDRLDGSKKVCFSSQPFPPSPRFFLFRSTKPPKRQSTTAYSWAS